jgi:hypothetical protein
MVSQARDQQRHVVQVEGEVGRAGGVGCAPAARARRRERQAENLLAQAMLDNAHSEGCRGKKKVKPAALRLAVSHTVETFGVNQRRA